MGKRKQNCHLLEDVITLSTSMPQIPYVHPQYNKNASMFRKKNQSPCLTQKKKMDDGHISDHFQR